jgi:hypothetical protein
MVMLVYCNVLDGGEATQLVVDEIERAPDDPSP